MDTGQAGWRDWVIRFEEGVKMGWLAAIAACFFIIALLAVCLFFAYEWWRRMAWSVPPLSFEMVAVNVAFVLLVIVLTIVALILIALILFMVEAAYTRSWSICYPHY